MVGAEGIKRAADAAVGVGKLAAEREAKIERRKGNKEEGNKARVEYRKRPPAVRYTRGIKLRGRDVVDL